MMSLVIWYSDISNKTLNDAFIFDILKLGPVKGMDDIKSGTGIMMDDVVAGIFALLITQSLVYFTG